MPTAPRHVPARPMPKVATSVEESFLLVVYRNFLSQHGGMSHVGLGVNALALCQYLRSLRVRCVPAGVWVAGDVVAQLRANPHTTHCLIEAPWIAVADLTALLDEFPHVHFSVRCHSQVGFLQVEAGAVNLLRQYSTLQGGVLNFSLSANSQRFADFWAQAYGQRCLYLPNLYLLPERTVDPITLSNPLRIGSFGAMRLLKNHSTAAAAALLVAREMNYDLEFYVSGNREEHGKGVVQALANLFSGVRWAKLVEVPWEPWPQFLQTVAHMDLCMQVSFTETFNLVTADAVAAGIPSVVSSAIEWVPPAWVADADDAPEIAKVGLSLLRDPRAGRTGYTALKAWMVQAAKEWVAGDQLTW